MKKYIALLLAGAMAFSAAGCGGAAEEMIEASTELNIYMWQDYISEDLISAFEEANGCTVNLTALESATAAVEKLEAGCGTEYDLVMVKNKDIGALVEKECLEKISPDKLPNTSTLNESLWLSKSYGIPYLMLYIYVVYDAKTCPVEIKGYHDLLEPALQGQISSVDGARNLFGIALTALGYSPNTTEESELAAAYDWLVKYNENVAVYEKNVQQNLIDGKIAVAVTYDRNAAAAMAKKPSIKIAPFAKDKIQAEVDMFVIPKEAQHVDLAKEFLNYICDPEVMAANLEEMPYSCPNDVAVVLASDAYKNAPERAFDYENNVFLLKSLEDAELYDVYYQKLKTADPAEEAQEMPVE